MTRAMMMVGAFALLVGAQPAAAGEFKMTCAGPKGEYVVSYDDALKTLSVGPLGSVTYRALSVDKSAASHKVSALAVNDAPAVRASFAPERAVEYLKNGKVERADRCR